MDKDFFIKVQDPVPLRIGMLEASKSSLVAAKYYLDLQEIRQKKTTALAKISQQITELNASFEKLLSLLPHQELLEELESKKKPEPKKKGAKSKSKTKKKRAVHKLSEVDKINRALEAIEAKINKLT